MIKDLLFSFLLISLTLNFYFVNTVPLLGNTPISNDIPTKILAEKYCDSLEKKLFKGLDNESILKYEYFFSSIPKDFIIEENKFLDIFKSQVKNKCSYEITKSDEKEFKSFLKKSFQNKK